MKELQPGSAAARVLVALVGIYALAVFAYQANLVADADYLHEEMRLLFRYHLETGPEPFAEDYITSFVAAFDQPYLYEALARLWLWAGGDLIALHRVIPLVCWLAFLAGLGFAAQRLGSGFSVVAVLALAVVQPVYLHQITSALPHAFAFPLLVWAFVALICGSSVGLALVTVLSGLLYPAISPLIGLLFAWHVCIAERPWQQQNPRRLANLVLLAGAGGLALWLLLRALGSPPELGAALQPLDRVDVYPENGPEGRHFYGVFNPFAYVVAKAFDQFHDLFGRMKLLLLLIYLLVSAYGFYRICRSGGRGQAVLALVVCSLVTTTLVFAVKPHLAYRFVLYPGFTLLPLLFVRGVEDCCDGFRALVRRPRVAAGALVLLFALTLDGIDARKIGFGSSLGPSDKEVIAFAAAQPPGTLFAVWPQSEGAMEFLPYRARQPIFVMLKAHYPTFETHILEMRARMEALVDAYLARDEAPLRRLRCRWGVDYLIAEKSHFRPEGERPTYFAPFDAQIEALWQDRRGSLLIADPAPQLIALETADRLVLRLPGPCEPD